MASGGAPSAYLLAALASAHAWGLVPLLAPRWLTALAAAMGHPDAGVPFAAGALVLSALQATAVLQWLQDARAGGAVAFGGTGAGVLGRAVLALPLLAAGAWLKLGAVRALGRSGLCFARQLGGRERAEPLIRVWPFTLTGAFWRRALPRARAPAICAAAAAPGNQWA